MKISCKTKKKSEALLFFADFQEELKRRERKEIKLIQLEDFRNEFVIYASLNYKDKTVKGFKNTFNFLISFFGNPYLSEITTDKAFQFIQSRMDKIYQARKDLINLKSSFNYAVDKNYLTENPFKKIKSIKIPEKIPTFFNESEFENLIKVIDEPDLKDIVIFAINTGLRQMELINLTWNVILNGSLIVTNWETLSKNNRTRSIPLNKKALEVLERRNKKNKYIFTINDKKWNQNWLTKKFKRAVRKAELNDNLNFHSLRHTFASWLVQRGDSIYNVSKLLGHQSVKTTEIYSHLRTDNLRKSVDRL